MFGGQGGGGLFGGAAASSGGGLFGGGAAASSGGGLFGGGAPAGGGLFGAAPAAGGGGLFGAAPAAGASGGLFGAAAPAGGGGLFGGGGAASGGGLFGGGASSGGGGLFGGGAASGGGLFGAAPAAGGGGGLFGGAAPAGGLFGGGAAAPAGGGLFGGGAAAPAGGGLFGSGGATGGCAGGFGGAAGCTGGGPQLQADAQLLCVELAKRMEEFYPTLQQASGRAVPAPAGGQSSALQQSFVAYTYSFCADPQRLQQANAPQFNPQVHVDYAKWVQAMQNNPDPSSCYPEPLVGLPALEARVGMQEKAVEDCTNALEELRNGFGNLKDALSAQSLQKLEECRRRHQMLSHQLLQVVAAVETYAAASGAARRCPQGEGALGQRLSLIEEAVHAPASARARLEELWVVLQGLLQRGAPNGGAARLSNAEAEKTLKITAQQGELLELLQEELARRKRDVAQFESALALPSAGAQAPRGGPSNF
mmetsp:Transcript_48420/g.155416  ORF Transcript_48420/g.155416 Transcript_48420/m.155416 type:complete len:479 (-) Transcript_48420:53-1489(-)